MGKIEFELDQDNLPAQAFAAWDVAGILLVELFVASGNDRTYIEQVKSDLLSRYTDMGEIGDLASAGIRKSDMERAARQVVQSVFDRIAWRDEDDPS